MRPAHIMIFAALSVAVAAAPAALAQSDELVVLETAQGTITIELFDEEAPGHAENLRTLADTGFYNSTLFHRLIPGFMIQGGDPNTIEGDPATWGTGGPSGTVPAEFNDIRHERGIVSMARSADPDSAGSQFFIVHSPSLFLDGQYTVFGRVVTEESCVVLDRIAALKTETPDRPIDAEAARITGAYTVPRADAGDLLEQPELARTGSGGLGAAGYCPFEPGAMMETEPAETETPETDAPAEDQMTETPETDAPAEDQPVEMDQMSTPDLVDGVYSNVKLGITLTPPEGWAVQEPRKTRAYIPDVVMVGTPAAGPLPPNITLDIQYASERAIEDYVDERLAERSEAIEAGALTIESREGGTVSDLDAVTLAATGMFSRNGTDIDVKFREVVLGTEDKFYAFTYSALADEFDAGIPMFESVLDSFAPEATAQMPADEAVATEPAAAEGGGCLIATAAYGTEMAGEVQRLREIRDGTVMRTGLGASFMAGFNDIYYAFSPAVADLERQSPEVREAVRALITPMILSLSIMSAVDADSEASLALFGGLVIALNVGIYVAAPAAAVWGAAKWRGRASKN